MQYLSDIKYDSPKLRVGVTYLATPYASYTGSEVEAADAACQYAAEFMKRGYQVFCPVAHGHPIAAVGDLDPFDYRLWMPQALAVLRLACARVVVIPLPGWKLSKGIQLELDHARELDTPAYLLV